MGGPVQLQCECGPIGRPLSASTSGRFTDTIPSPNAHCHAKLLAGAPPLKFTLTKPGAAPVAAQITTPGDAGEIKFDMW